MILSKIAADKHAAAFVGLGVVGKESQTPFALVTKRLKLGDEFVHPSFELLGRRRDADAAFLVPRREPRLLKIRQQHLADPGRHAGRVGKGVGCGGALLVRP